jgi:hypothetical protein
MTVPGFPTRKNAPIHVPAKATRRWLVKAKLQENMEMILALPCGPLLKLQYMMAMTGKRHVWNETTQEPQPMKRQVPRMGADGMQMRGKENEPLYDLEDVWLSDAEHGKLMAMLTDRIIPQLKSFEVERLKPNEQDPGDQELTSMTTEEIRERLEHDEAEVGEGTAAPGAGEA